MEWNYGGVGWAVSARKGAFFWVITSEILGLRPCYVQPFSQTNVPIGIDGLEFV